MARRTISQAEALLNGRADVTEEQMSGVSAVEVTITSGSKSITSFSGRSITLLLPVDAGAFQAGQSCAVYQISEDGALETHTGICRSRKRQPLGGDHHDASEHFCGGAAGEAGPAPLHRRA